MTSSKQDVRLFEYWRSSTSYRVRIALKLAKINYTSMAIDLLDMDQKSPDHLARNPQGLVPVLDIDGQYFSQSLATIEYLNDTRDLHLLPHDPIAKAKHRALAQAIAIDLHPVCNLSVLAYATSSPDHTSKQWAKHFITPALNTFNTLLREFTQAPFCDGDTPSLADLCLIPQLYNADRWGIDYSHCARIQTVRDACAAHPAFQAAHPDRNHA